MKLIQLMKICLGSLAIVGANFFPLTALAGRVISGGVIGGGGGGNALEKEKVRPYEIEETVEVSKASIIFFLQGMEMRKAYKAAGLQQRYEPVFDKLFRPRINFIDLVKNTRVELQPTGPCFDPKGNAMDGSANLNKPNSVCISTERLA